MTPPVAVQAQELVKEVCSAESYSAAIEAKFHRLLEADRNSAEFAELWLEVDAYLSAVVEAERQV